MTSFLHDLRVAGRGLGRAPAFTTAAVAILAVGIGAATALFSVVDGVLLRPLPFTEPDRLVTAGYLGNGDYRLVREHGRSFQELALYASSEGYNLSSGGATERVAGARVSPNLFSLLGVAPALGRGFPLAAEDPGHSRVVMLSQGLWQERFAADPGVIDREILIDSVAHTVVGVMPAGLDFPGRETRLWVPHSIDPADPVSLWGGAGGQSVGRLRSGATAQSAQAELRGMAGLLREANTLWAPPPEYGTQREVLGFQDHMVGEVRTRLLVAFGAVGFVLLVSCANVANLLLARGAGRSRELAVRAVLGAGTRRLARHLLAESALLAAAGGAIGVALAVAGQGLLLRLLPTDTPRLGEVAIDRFALGFALGASLLTLLLAGLYPAARAARAQLGVVLAGGAKGVVGAGRGVSRPLVIAQVALAVVVTIGAGLMLRSLDSLLAVDPGFSPSSLIAARVTPPEARYDGPRPLGAFYDQLMERVDALPGVSAVALVDRLPLSAWAGGLAFEVEGNPYIPGSAAPTAQDRRVTPGYHRLMGIPLLSGRLLEEGDRAGAPDVALINETMARQHWPGEDPVGQRFRPVWWRDRWITVVGVVADVHQFELGGEVEPEIYRPLAQMPAAAMHVVVRADPEPAAVVASLRAAVRELDPEVPLSEVVTLEQVLARSVSGSRSLATVLSGFAALALALGAVGLYGVIAFAVAGRRHEIGVRVALGARPVEVLGLVVGQGVRLAALGTALGVAIALAGGRVLEGLLFEVSARDPVTFALVPLLLLAVAALASLLPARRATRVDPMTALRAES